MSKNETDLSEVRTPERLEPEAAGLLTASPEARIRFVQRDKWIAYPAAKELLTDLNDLMNHPRRARMPCRLIIAPTNNGKTNLLGKLLESFPADPNPAGGAIHLPILHAQFVEPDERHLYIELLKALFEKIKPSQTLAHQRDLLMGTLAQVKPKMILIDEANTLVNGSVTKQRQCLNTLKNISNVLNISIVAAGTPEAQHVFRSEAQVANRFEPRALPLWELGNGFRALLKSFEKLIPLPSPSGLHGKAFAHDIFHRTDRTIGEVAKLLEKASIHAIRNNAPCITRETLDACGYVSPSNRYDLAGIR